MPDFYNNLYRDLIDFGSDLISRVRTSVQRREVIPDTTISAHWKIEGFEYNDTFGPKYTQMFLEETPVTHWGRAELLLTRQFLNLPKFKEILALLAENAPSNASRHDSLCEGYVRRIVYETLINSSGNETFLNHIVQTTIKEIKAEPILHGAIIELNGIIPLMPSVEFIVNGITIKLRQTIVSDLEKELSILWAKSPINMTAILEISWQGKEMREIQRNLDESTAILRLFKTGSILELSCKSYSESVTMGVMTRYPDVNNFALEKYQLFESDIPRLEIFWRALSSKF